MPPPPPPSLQPPTCLYNLSLAGQRCMGLSFAEANSTDLCPLAACAAGVQAWQWEASQGCWIGAPSNCGPGDAGWQGGATTAPAGPPPPPAAAPQAQPGFDDSAWEVVDIPHDATVTGNYSRSANGGEGFLPSPRTWYRKAFVCPAAWSAMSVTLVVDAALSTTTWWLNGRQVAVQNPAGYLPYVLRLDGSAGLLCKDNASNLLVAYADGRLTTGWWVQGGLGAVRVGWGAAASQRARSSRLQTRGGRGGCSTFAPPSHPPPPPPHPPPPGGMRAAVSSALQPCMPPQPLPLWCPLASPARATRRAPSRRAGRPRRASSPTRLPSRRL